MNRISVYGYALLAFSVIVGAVTPIAFSLGSAIPFTTLLFYVSIVGVITSFIMMIAKGTTNHLRGLLKDRTFFFAILILAVLEYIIEPLGLSYATHFVTADLTAVVYRTWTIMLILIAPFVMSERITKWDLAAVSISFFALAATVVGGTAISMPAAALPYVGILLVVAFGVAIANAVSKRYNYDLMTSIFCYNLIALIAFAPLAILTNTWQLVTVTPNVIFSIIFLGAIFYAVFGFTFFEALRVIKTSIFSTIYVAVPFITMVISAVFLGVPVIPSYIVIGVGVVSGIAIQRLAPRHASNFLISKRHKDRFKVSIYDVTSAFINTKQPSLTNTMHGGGRILAFYTHGANGQCISKEELDSMGGSGCTMFSDKHHPHMLSADELEFIRDITGATDQHMIVIGSGDPARITERFSAIDGIFASRNPGQGVFPV